MEFKRIGQSFVNLQSDTSTSNPVSTEEAQKPDQTSNNEISSAYGNRDTWQTIDQVSTFELNRFGTPTSPPDAPSQPSSDGDSSSVYNPDFPELFQRFLDPLSNLSQKVSNDSEEPTVDEVRKLSGGSVFRKKP